jgi:hypothetical protein
MKIKVTEERECCQPQDLKAYRGQTKQAVHSGFKFCQYCGQIWTRERVTDAAGSSDWELVRVDQ